MLLLRSVGRHPLVLLGALGVAFLGWICWDLILPQPVDQMVHPPVERAANPLQPPTQPDALTQDPLPPNAPAELGKLKPGMPRNEVEELLGAPSAQAVFPAVVADGRVTYSVSYEADLGPMPTIRPIRPQAHPAPRPEANAFVLVMLDFDATKSGHPLLRVRVTPPRPRLGLLVPVTRRTDPNGCVDAAC
jgi:hypothetical protein